MILPGLFHLLIKYIMSLNFRYILDCKESSTYAVSVLMYFRLHVNKRIVYVKWTQLCY